MYVAIDSSRQHRFTGTVSGHDMEISKVYDDLTRIMKSSGVNPPFHWSKISRKVKESSRREIVGLVNNSKLTFNIFQHSRPINMSRKELFLRRLPNSISQVLEIWLKNKYGQVNMEVDNDYNFSNSGTEEFIQNLISSICFRLVGGQVKIRGNDMVRATVKQDSGVILDFYGKVSDSKRSKGIQLIDVVMGFALEDKEQFKQNRMYVKKIC